MDSGRHSAWGILASWLILLAILCSVPITGAQAQAESKQSSTSLQIGAPESLWPVWPGSAARNIAQAGLLVSPAELELAEDGGSASYQVSLAQQPTAPVIITVNSDDQVSLSITMLLFDEDDWNNQKKITVSAIDDEVAEGSHDSRIRHSASSFDPSYDELDPVYVTATIEDNDSAGIQVEPTALTVSEPDGTAVFTMTLLSEPMWDVDLPLEPSNSECDVSPTRVTLDSDNWRTGARATVSARDDDRFDGDQTCIIDVESPSTKDPIYRELDPDDVTVTVQDNERVQIFLPQVIRIWPPRPDAPIMQTIDNPDGDGAFAVEWDAAAWAATYILEHGASTLFKNPVKVYEGPATSHQVQDFGASRRYFRVKARNSSGDGSWSNAEQVDVVWHLEGTGQADREERERQTNGPIVSGLTYSGRISDQNDLNDYYYFELPAWRDVELDLRDIPAGQNYDLAIRDGNLNTQEGWYSVRSGNRDEHVSVTLPPGRYYVQIHSGGGTGSSQAYRLELQY